MASNEGLSIALVHRNADLLPATPRFFKEQLPKDLYAVNAPLAMRPTLNGSPDRWSDLNRADADLRCVGYNKAIEMSREALACAVREGSLRTLIAVDVAVQQYFANQLAAARYGFVAEIEQAKTEIAISLVECGAQAVRESSDVAVALVEGQQSESALRRIHQQATEAIAALKTLARGCQSRLTAQRQVRVAR